MITVNRALIPVLIAALVGSLWGFPFEDKVTWRPVSGVEIDIAHPFWSVFLVGIGVGLFGIPWVIECINRDKEYERFYREFRDESMARMRSRFFMYLSRAYEAWRRGQPGTPIIVDELIEQSLYPDWLPLTEGDLTGEIRARFSNNPPPIWRFCRSFYGEIDAYLRRRQTPTLLHPSEIIKFHDARQRLAYFWDDTGVLVYRFHRLRYRRIRRHMDNDRRLLLVLTYLTLALHDVNDQRGRGAIYFHYLAAIYFGTRTRCIRDWIRRYPR